MAINCVTDPLAFALYDSKGGIAGRKDKDDNVKVELIEDLELEKRFHVTALLSLSLAHIAASLTMSR